ncbi:hypothetical protein SLS60_008565 [Paraconiothyrium brasiliense]|uniref:Uncharacterized protein n=1 Tax=Paraconiothyrium brasiliense TaxID=300254 RepID=A0ABR3QY89_9PLEO
MNSDIGLQAIADDIGTPKGSSVDFKRHDQSEQEPISKEHSSRKGEAKKQYHQKGDDMRKESRKTQCDQERQFRVVCCEENQDHDDPWNGPVDDV